MKKYYCDVHLYTRIHVYIHVTHIHDCTSAHTYIHTFVNKSQCLLFRFIHYARLSMASPRLALSCPHLV